MGSKLFWSTLFGVVTIILLGATLYVRSLAPAPTKSAPTTTVVPLPSPSPAPQLTVILPADDAYLTSAATRIVGKAKPGSTISITGAETNVIVDVDQSGSFSTEVTLKEGANELTITSVAADGTETHIARSVLYEPEDKR